MSKPETLQQVTQIYREGEKINGCTDLAKVANAISVQTGFPDIKALVYEARRISRPDHLYDGALQTVRYLVGKEDQVTIWTQGHVENQFWKVAGTGISEVRKGLPHPERRRFSVYADMDKIATLEDPVNKLVQEGVNQAVIVDDKSSNIVAINGKLSELRESGRIPAGFDIKVVWARYGAYKDKAPTGWNLEDFANGAETISDIKDLQKMSDDLPGRTGWLLDFDHTLMDTTTYNREMYGNTAHQVDGINGILPSKVGHSSGLTGQLKSANVMKHGGMSGSHLIFVETVDGNEWVVKHHHGNSDRVGKDIQGYQFLAETPLTDKMPKIEISDIQKGFLVLPHLKGRTIREGLLRGDVDEKTAIGLYEQLLDLKKIWWPGQERQIPGDFKSMQRTEWLETKALIPEVINEMAAYFGVSESSFWKMPLRVGGRKLPALETVVKSVGKLLDNPPGYVIGVHGDATGSNIILDPSVMTWSLIDAEWAGMGDPAESFVRMAKHRSTTTAVNTRVRGIGTYEEGLGIRVDGTFSPAAHSLHEYVTGRAGEFAQALNDPGFIERFRTYFAGSYLRELALTVKRGSMEGGVLAMVMAGESLSAPALHRIAA